MRTFLAGLLVTCAAWGGGACGAEGLTVLEPWSNAFSGRDLTFHVVVPPSAGETASLNWQLAAEGGTLARGVVSLAGSDRGGAVDIRIPATATKTGVILPLRLRMTAVDSGREIGRFERTLWFFPDRPFADRQAWLEELHLRLFDPVGATRELFQREHIPFREIRSADAISDLQDGVLVIGEGISFQDYRGLPAAMFRAASRGADVLCLAPAAGTLVLPATSPFDGPAPSGVEFRRQDSVVRIDKRLDADGWAPKGRSLASSFQVLSERGALLAEVGTDPGGWAWLDVEYAPVSGECLVCGLAVVAAWPDSPTPRYLLLKLFEKLSSHDTVEPGGDSR